MTTDEIFEFIKKQKTVFISSVDDNGYPWTRAMLAPRRIEGKDIYLSTNTSSQKVKQFLENSKACMYFYQRGRFKYQGLMILGEVKICQDEKTKASIWKLTDRMFYKKGVNDPDYCVLKFTCLKAEYYCDMKVEELSLS